jgi:hypothetical protein
MRRTDSPFPFRTAGVGLIIAAVGWIWTNFAHDHYGPALIVAGAMLTAGAIWRGARPGTGSNAMIGRWDRKNRRNAGTASRWDILTTSSRWAMRRRASVLRPSLRGAPLSRRLQTPVRTFATPLCRVGSMTVWTSIEESTLRVAIAPAVSWVTDPAAVAAGDAKGIGLLDVRRFIDEDGTLYLLGDDDGVVGPLVGALTAEIAYQ